METNIIILVLLTGLTFFEFICYILCKAEIEYMRCCPECGYSGKISARYPGDELVELILWLLLIIPGALYTKWRWKNSYLICHKCGSRDVQPIT